MSLVSDYLRLKGLLEDDASWRLLRSRMASFILAVIAEHFDEETKSMEVSAFESAVALDMDEVAARTGEAPDRSAHALCEDWRRAGYIVRRSSDDGQGEVYEPSQGARRALAFTSGLGNGRRVATQSKLSALVESVSDLALKVSEDPEVRLAELRRRRAEIDAEMAAIGAGHVEVLDDALAAEGVREAVASGREILLDFGRVVDDYRALTAEIYRSILDDDASAGAVLDDIFRGYDRLAASPSGVSFRAFFGLLGSIEDSERLDEDISTILSKMGIAELVPSEDRVFLENLVSILHRGSSAVDAERAAFASGIRRFVESRAYQRDRLLKESISNALTAVTDLAAVEGARRRLGASLDLASVRIDSVSRVVLANPLDELASAVSIEADEGEWDAAPVDFRAQVRENGIDFDELAENVNEVVRAAQGRGAVSVADVLEARPATQGAASVLGLMMLGLSQGVDTGGSERVFWTDPTDGSRWTGVIDEFRFEGEVFAL